jgi:hypothetical protein
MLAVAARHMLQECLHALMLVFVLSDDFTVEAFHVCVRVWAAAAHDVGD